MAEKLDFRFAMSEEFDVTDIASLVNDAYSSLLKTNVSIGQSEPNLIKNQIETRISTEEVVVALYF